MCLNVDIVTTKSEAFFLLWREFISFWFTFLPCIIEHAVTTLYTLWSCLICGHWALYSQRGLRRGSVAVRLLGLWVQILPETWMSVASVVCCQVEISVSDWSLVQRSPTECGVSNWLWSGILYNEEALAHWGCCAMMKKMFFVQHMKPTINL